MDIFYEPSEVHFLFKSIFPLKKNVCTENGLICKHYNYWKCQGKNFEKYLMQFVKDLAYKYIKDLL